MKNHFSSQNISNPSSYGTPSTIRFSDSPSVNRRIVDEESHPTEGLVKQYKCEQKFDENSNIKQLKFSTIFTAGGKLKGQNTWNVNFPPLSDAANFIGRQTKCICDKSSEIPPLRSSNDNFATLTNISDDDIMILDDKSTSESIRKTTQSQMNLKSHMEDNSKSSKLTESQISRKNDLTFDQKSKQELIRLMNRSSRLKKFDPTRRSRKLRPLVPKDFSDMQTTEPSNSCMKFVFFVLVGVIAVIVSSLWNEINENPFDFTNASLELRANIYGQDNAINQLIDHYRTNVETFNVVVLVGGSGVGKSYTGKIIEKHFPHKHNIFEYNPPLENVHKLAYNSLSSMHCNLVILEHLKLNHLTDLVNFVKLLQNRAESCAMILAIINPEVTDDKLMKTIDMEESLNEIDVAFSTENIQIKIISFDPLTSDIIDICIKNEAQRNDIHLTDEQFQKVRRHLLSANSGCKGAYAKVQLYAKT